MRFKRVLPRPRRFVRWLAILGVLGLIMPTAIASVITLVGYYPIGVSVSTHFPWNSFGVVLVVMAVGAIVLVTGAVYSLLAWDWRLLALTALLEVFLYAGIFPANIALKHMQLFAFELLKTRSSEVVTAITTYTAKNGTPPASLVDLVPDYLPSVPMTGMALKPYYQYEPRAGPCALNPKWNNDWHLLVTVQEFLLVHWLFYCPEQGEWLYEQSD